MYMGNSETRQARRRRVLMKAVVIGADGPCSATIKDFSAGGAQLSSSHPPPADCDVIFKRRDIFAAARVAWTDGNSYGIEFYREIEAAKLSRSISEH